MTDAAAPTGEEAPWIADVRRQAEYEVERFPNDDWPPVVLALLAEIDSAAERHVARECEVWDAGAASLARHAARTYRWWVPVSWLLRVTRQTRIRSDACPTCGKTENAICSDVFHVIPRLHFEKETT